MESRMRRDWMSAGDQAVAEMGGREIVGRAITQLRWIDVREKPKLALPMSQGLAIKAAIQNYRIPRVQAIALEYSAAPAMIYGIRAEYRNALVQLYFHDDGVALTTIAADVWPKGEEK